MHIFGWVAKHQAKVCWIPSRPKVSEVLSTLVALDVALDRIATGVVPRLAGLMLADLTARLAPGARHLDRTSQHRHAQAATAGRWNGSYLRTVRPSLRS